MNMSQKQLAEMIRKAETPDGSESHVRLNEHYVVKIVSVYVYSSGPHRAWKRLYYLLEDGHSFGGYDRRDSFVQWALRRINQPGMFIQGAKHVG